MDRFAGTAPETPSAASPTRVTTAAKPERRLGSRVEASSERSPWETRYAGVAVGLSVVIGAALRLRWLGEPMRYDEAATFQKYALGSVGHIVGTYDRPNNQVFYSLLTHFSLGIFGHAVWVVRAVAFAAGVALVPVAYLVAARIHDRLVGLWAAALVATAAPLIDYSVNGRGYTLGALLVLLALWLGAGLLERQTLARWRGFVVCCVLAVWTIPTMAIGVAIVAVWMALQRVDRQMLVRLAIALGVAGLLSLLLYSAALGQSGWDAVTPLGRNWNDVTGLIDDIAENWTRAAPHPLDWLLGVAFVGSLFVERRLAIATGIVLLAVIAFGPIAPFVRSWLFLLPFFLIQASVGLAYVSRRAGVVAPLVAAVVLGICVVGEGLRSADVPPISDNDIVGLLKKYARPHEHILIDRYTAAPTHYYYYERYGDPGVETHFIRSTDRENRHIVVVVPRGTSPVETVAKAGGAAAGRARLLDRREWIDFYDVPLRSDAG